MTRKPLTSKDIKSYSRLSGFDLCGITTPEIIPRDSSRFAKWLSRGFHGEMSYMAKDPERRIDPGLSLVDVRSIIMLAINYYQTDSKASSPGLGRVARYARGRDYHKIIEKRTRELLRRIQRDHPAVDTRRSFRWFVDYGPFLERAYAEKAGLGYIGKNSLLISEEYGSWILLSEILTNIELEPDVSNQDRHGRCGSCRRCIDHCPTGAIIAPGVVDSNKCISYLTIEKRTEIEQSLRSKLGSRVFGCDICQEVCPQNLRAIISDDHELAPQSGVGEFLDLRQIAQLANREDFLKLTSGTALTRPKLEGLKRNARACAENQDG